MKSRVLDFLERQAKGWLWTEATSLAVLVGWIDFRTGYEVNCVLFYCLPILLMVWFADRTSAICMAIFCTIFWWWADEASGHPYIEEWHMIWETIAGLGFFLLFVAGATAAKSRIALLERSRMLEEEIIRISDREQRRIGYDLHDGLCQYYAAVGCAAGSLKCNLEKEGSQAAASAAEIEKLIMKGVEQARSLARGLSPVENEHYGLQFALEDLAMGTRNLHGIDCQLICERGVPIFDSMRATQLYRIAQEAINNATRHGKARSITIHLCQTKEVVALSIEDDGVGIPEPLAEHRGMGLSIMQYRARMVGGDLNVARRPNCGTIVTVTFQQKLPPDFPG